VKLSQRMRAQYPEEMTIVLQHQFWDLTVDDEHFEVGLSFNGIPERLSIPFAAIKGFFDPSVQFGLQFEEQSEEEAVTGVSPDGKSAAPTNIAKQDTLKSARPTMPELPFAAPAAAQNTPAAPVADKTGGAEVVRLDRFRKK
jgi:hypothetical protein